jgi:hypothetical protein
VCLLIPGTWESYLFDERVLADIKNLDKLILEYAGGSLSTDIQAEGDQRQMGQEESA